MAITSSHAIKNPLWAGSGGFLKRFVYGIPLILTVVVLVYVEWFWLAGLLAGFLFGFVLAIDLVYRKATGGKLDNEGLTEVLEKLLP